MKITEEQKAQIKANFYLINAEKLKDAAKNDPAAKEALKYYNRIKAGKLRYSKAIKINGKIVASTFQKQIERDAKGQGMTLKEYWEKNRRIIADFYENGYITKKKKATEIFKLAEEKSAKGYTLYINGRKKSKLQFISDLQRADNKISTETGAGFILWKVNISDARKIITINIDALKIKKLVAAVKKSKKRRNDEF